MWGISHLILIFLICFANVVFSKAFDQSVPAEARLQPPKHPKHLGEDQIVPDVRSTQVPNSRRTYQVMRHDNGSAGIQNSRSYQEAPPRQNRPPRSAANPPRLQGRFAPIPEAERFQDLSRWGSSPSMLELGSKSTANPAAGSRKIRPPLPPRNKQTFTDNSLPPPPTVNDVSNIVRSWMPKARDAPKESSRRKPPQGQRLPTKADTQLGASAENFLVEEPTKNPMYHSSASEASDSTGSRGSIANTATKGSSKGGHSTPWPIPDEIIYLPPRQDEQRRSPSSTHSSEHGAIAAQIDEMFKGVYGSEKSFNGSPISTRGSRKSSVGSYPSSGSSKYSSSGMMSEWPFSSGSSLSSLDSPFPGVDQAVSRFPVSPSELAEARRLAQNDSEPPSARRTKTSSFENLTQKIVSKLKRKSKGDTDMGTLRSFYDNVDGSLEKRLGSRTESTSPVKTASPTRSWWRRIGSAMSLKKILRSPSRPAKRVWEKDEDFVFLGSPEYRIKRPEPSYSA